MNEQAAAPRLPLPDPKIPQGPYRPFTSDPGWSEVWWWLGLPVLACVVLVAISHSAPNWFASWVLPEGYGILEVSQFATLLAAFAIAFRLLCKPFVRQRPFVLLVTIIAALTCLYTAGEEMSWGQHFFHWNTPGRSFCSAHSRQSLVAVFTAGCTNAERHYRHGH
jgi:hypothetical protein